MFHLFRLFSVPALELCVSPATGDPAEINSTKLKVPAASNPHVSAPVRSAEAKSISIAQSFPSFVISVSI